MRWVALLLACLLTAMVLPARAATPTLQSYGDFTQAQFQEIADGLYAVPEVQRGLGEGALVWFFVSGARPEVFEGTVSGGRLGVTEVDQRCCSADAKLTASRDLWGSLVNACDRANTAKLGLRDGYIGIDGGAGAKAAAKAIRTGRFDAQLAATRPVAGATFPCMGESPVLKAHALYFGSSLPGRLVKDADLLTAEISGRTYLVNKLGALEGQLPSGWLATGAATTYGGREYWDAYDFVSKGVGPVPEECKVADAKGDRWLRTYIIAACLKQRQGASS